MSIIQIKGNDNHRMEWNTYYAMACMSSAV